MTLAIDPGPTACGAVLYDPAARRVLWSSKAASVSSLCRGIGTVVAPWGVSGVSPSLVLIERVQSYGIAGASLLLTSESVGRLWQACQASGVPHLLVPRRLVCTSLDVSGGGEDAQVRRACIDRVGAPGLKRAPGATYGVTSHAWQALGLAVAYHEAPLTLRARMDEEGAT